MNSEFGWIFDFCEKAGKVAFKNQKDAVGTEKKKDNIVTQTDIAISNLFEEYIAENTDGSHVIIDEEKAGLKTVSEFKKENEKNKNIWVIDPIDGTTPYFQGMELYGTMVSHFVDGEPVLSVIYCPALKKLVYADANEAYLLENVFTVDEKKSKLEANSHNLNGTSVVICSNWLRNSDGERVKFDFTKFSTLDLYCAAVLGLYSFSGKVHGCFIGDVMKAWDVSTSILLSKHSDMKVLNLKTGEKVEKFSLDLFNEDWAMSDLHLVCQEKHFDEIKTILIER